MKRRQPGPSVPSSDVRVTVRPLESENSPCSSNLNHIAPASLSLLIDPDALPKEKSYALRSLRPLVKKHWHEIAEFLPCLEELCMPLFPDYKLAALLAAETYFCMNDYRNAIHFALLADTLFEEAVEASLPDNADFVRCVLAQCVEMYGRARRRVFACNATLKRDVIEQIYTEEGLNRKIEMIVERMVGQSVDSGNHKVALGVCVDVRRLDLIRSILCEAPPSKRFDLLSFLYKVVTQGNVPCQSEEDERFRKHCYLIMAEMAYECENWDHYFIINCLYSANHPKRIANCIHYILQTDRPDIITSPTEIANQIVFNLLEHANQGFMRTLRLAFLNQKTFCTGAEPEHQETLSLPGGLASFFISTLRDQDFILTQEAVRSPHTFNSTLITLDRENNIYDCEIDDDIEFKPDGLNCSYNEADALFRLMNNRQRLGVMFQSLIRHNCASLILLKQIKDSTRGSLGQSGIIIANGLMHAATTCDSFLRDNLSWLSHASCWAKFSATASLGLIHRFHEREALRLMEAYLPRDNASNSPGDSPYAEGGGLYAIGLIYAGHEAGEIQLPASLTENQNQAPCLTITNYLVKCLNKATHPVVKHGACLGIGLTSIGSRDPVTVTLLLHFLGEDDAIIGEAAAFAVGMVMTGPDPECSSNPIDLKLAEKLLFKSENTEHDKVTRGIGTALALLALGKRNHVWKLVELIKPYALSCYLRCSIPMAIGLAWVGSGNFNIIQKLLDYAVNDVNDDVRRAACIAMGFVFYRAQPKAIGSILNLLKDSYNPHVRFGACLAFGISCMRSPSVEIIETLRASTSDPVPFVRVAANLALAMVFNDHPDKEMTKTTKTKTSSQRFRVREFRIQLMRQIQDKMEDVMVRYASILSFGILDAFGRNAHLSLMSESEYTEHFINYEACVGMYFFTQLWYWFPLTHMIALAYKPNSVCLVTKDMRIPDIKLTTKEDIKEFVYVPSIEEKRLIDKRQERIEAAFLASARQRKRPGYTSLARVIGRAHRGNQAISVKKQDGAGKPSEESIVHLKPGQPHEQSGGSDHSINPSTYAEEITTEAPEVSIRNLTPVRQDMISTLYLKDSRFELLQSTQDGYLCSNFSIVLDKQPESDLNCISTIPVNLEVEKPPAEEPQPPAEFEWNEEETSGEKMDVDEEKKETKDE